MAIFVVVGLIVLAVIAYAIYTQVHARPSFTIATESEAPTGTGEQSQEPFNEEDSAAQMIRLDLIDQLARTYFGQEQGAQGTQDDLKLLQKLTDKFLDTPMRDAVLVAAGAAFGNVLANDLGMEWIISIWEDGERVPALRDPETTVVVFPLSVLIKRAAAGEPLDVKYLYFGLHDGVSQLRTRDDLKRR